MQDNGKVLYTLYYRQGMNPHPLQKNFYFEGDLHSAIVRSRKHCELMGIKFISVRPFLSNIDEEEKGAT